MQKWMKFTHGQIDLGETVSELLLYKQDRAMLCLAVCFSANNENLLNATLAIQKLQFKMENSQDRLSDLEIQTSDKHREG